MKQLSVLIKPASSLCNMRCRYCFYADVSNMRAVKSYGMMTRETAGQIIDNIFRDLQPGDGIGFAFQGGEPTLAGLDFFRDFKDMVDAKGKNVRVSWSLQTNGSIIDPGWCRFLRDAGYLVGLSADGGAALHNRNRLDASLNGTYSRIMKTKRMMDEMKVEYNILCVLTNEAARHPQRIWKFIKEENIRYIQFIPCLGELSCAPSLYALTPERFAGFYTGLFPLWETAFENGNYVSVKLFDDIINLLARGIVNACGMTGQCQPQYVVEADGGVYPCDFYVLDGFRLGNLTKNTLRELYDTAVMQRFLCEKRALPAICGQCGYRRICNGGCKRMERSMYYGPEAKVCGYRMLLDKLTPDIGRFIGRHVNKAAAATRR